MTAIITLCQANEVLKELRPLLFEIFEYFAITAKIPAVIAKNSNISKSKRYGSSIVEM